MIRALTPVELSQWLRDPAGMAPQLLDVREPWEVEICRLAGSRLMPLSGWAPEGLGLDPGRPVVALCHHGVRSYHAALALERAGFADVWNLTGGLDAWAAAVDPAMPRY